VRATAIVPVKRFDRAKSRLSGSPASAHRPVLAKAMLSDVLLGLVESRLLDRIIVVSGESDAVEIAIGAGADHLDDPDDAGHNEAAAIGIADAIERGAECVALLPGDCPLLEGFELDRELEAQAPGVAIIPDHHGDGTNGLILSPPAVITPSFGPGSRERHRRLAKESGARCRMATIPSLALDLDTADDLGMLRAALAADPGRAPATAAALAELGDEPA
jgi:2-phospho-L-lactate guanylyltransferase